MVGKEHGSRGGRWREGARRPARCTLASAGREGREGESPRRNAAALVRAHALSASSPVVGPLRVVGVGGGRCAAAHPERPHKRRPHTTCARRRRRARPDRTAPWGGLCVSQEDKGGSQSAQAWCDGRWGRRRQRSAASRGREPTGGGRARADGAPSRSACGLRRRPTALQAPSPTKCSWKCGLRYPMPHAHF